MTTEKLSDVLLVLLIAYSAFTFSGLALLIATQMVGGRRTVHWNWNLLVCAALGIAWVLVR